MIWALFTPDSETRKLRGGGQSAGGVNKNTLHTFMLNL